MNELHRGAQRGDAAAVQRLLAAGAAVHAADSFGFSALCHAAFGSGDASTVRLLLDAGASPILATSTGMLPIHAAAMQGRTEALRVLLTAAPAKALAVDHGGVTPLLTACRAGADPEAVRLLVEAAPQAANMACATTDQVPIQFAAVAPNGGPAVQLLLQAAPQTLTARDSNGRTLLHNAGRLGRVVAVRALLAADPALACAVDGSGRLPLVYLLNILAGTKKGKATANIREAAFCLAECMPPPAAHTPVLTCACPSTPALLPAMRWTQASGS